VCTRIPQCWGCFYEEFKPQSVRFFEEVRQEQFVIVVSNGSSGIASCQGRRRGTAHQIFGVNLAHSWRYAVCPRDACFFV
jgi:hypothetical protein